jgi:hypothetical protein
MNERLPYLEQGERLSDEYHQAKKGWETKRDEALRTQRKRTKDESLAQAALAKGAWERQQQANTSIVNTIAIAINSDSDSNRNKNRNNEIVAAAQAKWAKQQEQAKKSSTKRKNDEIGGAPAPPPPPNGPATAVPSARTTTTSTSSLYDKTHDDGPRYKQPQGRPRKDHVWDEARAVWVPSALARFVPGTTTTTTTTSTTTSTTTRQNGTDHTATIANGLASRLRAHPLTQPHHDVQAHPPPTPPREEPAMSRHQTTEDSANQRRDDDDDDSGHAGETPAAHRPRKRRKKDANAPKQPNSTFLLYCRDHRDQVVRNNPGLKPTEVQVLLGQAWREASVAERNFYAAQRELHKVAYVQAKHEWRESQTEVAHNAAKLGVKRQPTTAVVVASEQKPKSAAKLDHNKGDVWDAESGVREDSWSARGENTQASVLAAIHAWRDKSHAMATTTTVTSPSTNDTGGLDQKNGGGHPVQPPAGHIGDLKSDYSPVVCVEKARVSTVATIHARSDKSQAMVTTTTASSTSSETGSIKAPRGRRPKGCHWDNIIGGWVRSPLPATTDTTNNRPSPESNVAFQDRPILPKTSAVRLSKGTFVRPRGKFSVDAYAPPLREENGIFKRPLGRAPGGCKWNYKRGKWVRMKAPIAPNLAVPNTKESVDACSRPLREETSIIKRPLGNAPGGYDWDGQRGKWVRMETPVARKLAIPNTKERYMFSADAYSLSLREETGIIKRPLGRAPNGCMWDYQRGMWAQNPLGKAPNEHVWDGERGRWVRMETPIAPKLAVPKVSLEKTVSPRPTGHESLSTKELVAKALARTSFSESAPDETVKAPTWVRVIPTSLPMKGKDGLFTRPKGRAPVGCSWDKWNGVWLVAKHEAANDEIESKIAEQNQLIPSKKPVVADYVPCGRCASCHVVQNCGTCLVCRNRPAAGYSDLSMVCVRRLCVAPVLRHDPPGQSQHSPAQMYPPNKKSSDVGAKKTAIPDDAVESLSEASSYDDSDDDMSDDQYDNVAVAKVPASAAELARLIRSRDRNHWGGDPDSSDDER